MTYIITEPCIGVKDASCVDVCPLDCIHTTDEDPMYYIDPDECIDCGRLRAGLPGHRNLPGGRVPEDQEKYIPINYDWFKDR